ncbi:hypothetical protein [uncultured Tateyamaria sp.]|nr:hypothetical protein [uncultured Tateyamaria sp.]
MESILILIGLSALGLASVVWFVWHIFERLKLPRHVVEDTDFPNISGGP